MNIEFKNVSATQVIALFIGIGFLVRLIQSKQLPGLLRSSQQAAKKVSRRWRDW